MWQSCGPRNLCALLLTPNSSAVCLSQTLRNSVQNCFSVGAAAGASGLRALQAPFLLLGERSVLLLHGAMPGAELACTPVCRFPRPVLTYSIVLVSFPEPAYHPAVPSTSDKFMILELVGTEFSGSDSLRSLEEVGFWNQDVWELRAHLFPVRSWQSF